IEEINANLNRLTSYENAIRNLPFKETLLIKEYLPIIRAYLKELYEELAIAEERVETARKILLECKKETKALNKLKENEWKRYLHELNLEEQKEIDEIAINNHFRAN
ncbi:MAG: FliJ family protein, partial [Syntrophomonadaceae bacterium]|nr:FliJ family protein [Syntrophomonadaceae bacterium]